MTFQSLLPSLKLSKDVESTIDAPFGSSFIENYVFGMENLAVTQDDPSRRVHDPFWTCWLDKEFFFFFEIIFNLRQQRLATQFKLYKHVIDDQMDSSLCVDKRFLLSGFKKLKTHVYAYLFKTECKNKWNLFAWRNSFFFGGTLRI